MHGEIMGEQRLTELLTQIIYLRATGGEVGVRWE